MADQINESEINKMDYKKIIESTFKGLKYEIETYSHIYGITIRYQREDRDTIFDRLDKYQIPVIGATENTITIPKR